MARVGTLAMATFDLMTCAYGVGQHEIIRFVSSSWSLSDLRRQDRLFGESDVENLVNSETDE